MKQREPLKRWVKSVNAGVGGKGSGKYRRLLNGRKLYSVRGRDFYIDPKTGRGVPRRS